LRQIPRRRPAAGKLKLAGRIGQARAQHLPEGDRLTDEVAELVRGCTAPALV
jgi:hypothetical protein